MASGPALEEFPIQWGDRLDPMRNRVIAYFFFLIAFLGLHLEVAKLGVESEIELPPTLTERGHVLNPSPRGC